MRIGPVWYRVSNVVLRWPPALRAAISGVAICGVYSGRAWRALVILWGVHGYPMKYGPDENR
jgi:hypothetical protein